MKVKATVNGNIKLELVPETTTDRYLVEMVKDRTVYKTTITKDGGFEITFDEIAVDGR